MENSNLQSLPLLALRGLVVFPGMVVYFDVGREKSILALNAAIEAGHSIFLAAQKDLHNEDPAFDELYTVGTVAKVRQLLKMPEDHVRVLVEGQSRAQLVGIQSSEPYLSANVSVLQDTSVRMRADRREAIVRHAKALYETYIELTPRDASDALSAIREISEPGFLADYIVQNMDIAYQEKQNVLETLAPTLRLQRVLSLLTHEIEVLELERDIQAKLRSKLGKNQRDYVLREHLKTIQNELGESADEQSEIETFRETILSLCLPEETEKKLLHELDRLGRVPTSSPEHALLHTWLDTCLSLPWHTETQDTLSLPAASRILEEDHYGLTKVKERILEFLAVKQMAPHMKGHILCLVGPPGVGKTSVAHSIARAMGRKMAQLSLGGVRDEADIRGHRKTYVGAMPGRILTALRTAGSKNAVILMDEIDKMGHDFRGDPSAALLEVFDPNQNHAFRDHYLEIPFDLSDILFITTANTTETIPRALLDRMEIIPLTSYTDEEKLHIVRRHLWPRQLTRHGLTKAQARISDTVLREVIAGYTRESGVRVLERKLAALCRKIARHITETGAQRVVLTTVKLEDYLGVRPYKPDVRRTVDEVGVVCGLAWTRVGGELLEVEAGAVPGTGRIDLTGNLGDVMKESARAALSYIRSRIDRLDIEPDFYKTKDIHVHFPEGDTPKDGPSAGITMATAIVSALTGAPVKHGIAMTGEITLRGRVLPIGGLKEKTMAALRAGIHTVLIPAANEKDLRDIDKDVYNALQFILVEHMDSVLDTALDWSALEKADKKEPQDAQTPPLVRPQTPPYPAAITGDLS